MKIFSDITEKNIDDWGKSLHEPKGLRKQRMNFWESFQKSPELNWKKKKIPQLKWDEVLEDLLPSWEGEQKEVEKKPPEGASGKITFSGNKVLRISLDRELANQGVIFTDMRTAMLERADLLESLLKNSGTDSEDQLSAFGKVFWINGYFLSIPKGVKIEKPFQVQFIQAETDDQLLMKNIIHIEEGASGSLEEISESESTLSEKTLCSSETKILGDKRAHFQFYSIRNWSEHVYDLSEYSFLAKRDAKIQALFSLLGSDSGRISISGDSKEAGSRIQHDGIIIGSGKQRKSIHAKISHGDQETEGLMRYKGILFDESYINLEGDIQTHPKAQQSISRLEEKILLLSDKAKCDALPALKIQTDNVQVSHAAAITQVDEERLFYLMSRGLSEEASKALLMEGFFEDLLKAIPDEKWYDLTKVLIESHLLSAKK